MRRKICLAILSCVIVQLSVAQYNSSSFDMENFIKGKWSNYAYQNGWVGYQEYPDSLEREYIFYPKDSLDWFAHCLFQQDSLWYTTEYELAFSYNLSFADSAWVFQTAGSGFQTKFIITVFDYDSVTFNMDAITDGGPDYFYRLDNETYVNCDSILDTVLTGIRKDLNWNTTLFPNPTNEFVDVQLSENQQFTLNLVSQEGRNVYTGETNSKGYTRINMRSLPKGVYFLKISHASKHQTWKKIVKM